MKQIIDYMGRSVDGIDSYVIDGSRKGRHLTRESMAYIMRTLSVGGSDVHTELDRYYRIAHVSRCTDSGGDSWTIHVPCDARGELI